MNELTTKEQIAYDGLMVELRDILTESGKRARILANEFRLELGDAIVRSPLYKHSGAELVKSVSREMGKSEETVYLWVRFAESKKLFADDMEMPWNKVVKKLQGREEAESHIKKSACTHCPLHCGR